LIAPSAAAAQDGGGTEFRFVTEGIHAALEATPQRAAAMLSRRRLHCSQYLRARLIDELHLAIRPVLLGSASSWMASI
jgi:hypothetical protein